MTYLRSARDAGNRSPSGRWARRKTSSRARWYRRSSREWREGGGKREAGERDAGEAGYGAAREARNRDFWFIVFLRSGSRKARLSVGHQVA
jgi:hypothetical protein